MTTLVDGLGFEELGDSVDAGSKTSQLWITGSVTSESQISGLNVFAQGSGTFGRLTDSNGALLPAVIGSPSSYGAFIQAGSISTGAGSSATIEFGTQFNSQAYFMNLTAAEDNSGKAPYVSGTKNVSGCEIVGEASAEYHYVAVGL